MEWSKLKSRERKVILIFGLAVFFGLYMRFVDQPVSKKVAGYKTQIRRSEAQLKDLEAKQPQDAELEMKIRDLTEDESKLSQEIEQLEKMVPSSFYTSQLIGELTRLASEVKLESIKQKIAKEQANSRIFLDVKFYASYLDAVRYVASIESISPFIRIDEMEILEPAGKTLELGGAPVRLLVSCLLSDSAAVSPLKAAVIPDLKMKRDILASSSRPAEDLTDAKFTLEGITFDLKNPTAIINGDVFQVNSELGGYKIKKILADTVVLSDGIEDHLLSLKTVAEKTK